MRLKENKTKPLQIVTTHSKSAFLVSICMKTKFRLLLAFSMLVSLLSEGQQESSYAIPKPKRLIDRVEVVVGAGLCFNTGNMFIENYRGIYANNNYVENKRLTKVCYSFGVGAYHVINDRIDINARILFERKGYSSELNNPLNPVNNNARNYRTSDYNYTYWTVPITARLQIGQSKKFSILLGGYLSLINSVSGEESFYNTQDNSRSASSFIGRTLIGFRADGGINSVAFIPGLQSFEQ
jgi:hypothetical protein